MGRHRCILSPTLLTKIGTYVRATGWHLSLLAIHKLGENSCSAQVMCGLDLIGVLRGHLDLHKTGGGG